MSQNVFVWSMILTGISVGAWVLEGWPVLKALLALRHAGRHLSGATKKKFSKVQSIMIVAGVVVYFAVNPFLGVVITALGMISVLKSVLAYVVEAVGCLFHLASTLLSDGIPLLLDLTLTFALAGSLNLATGATGAMLGLLASDIFSAIILISKFVGGKNEQQFA